MSSPTGAGQLAANTDRLADAWLSGFRIRRWPRTVVARRLMSPERTSLLPRLLQRRHQPPEFVGQILDQIGLLQEQKTKTGVGQLERADAAESPVAGVRLRGGEDLQAPVVPILALDF